MTQMTIPEWTLGWRLQRSLAHAGVSIDEMAEELGVSRQSVSRWLNEHGMPRRAYLKLWALRTGVPLEWLVSGGGHQVRVPSEEGFMFDKTSPAPGLGAAA